MHSYIAQFFSLKCVGCGGNAFLNTSGPYSQPKMSAPVGGRRSRASFGWQPLASSLSRGSGYEATARICGGAVTGVSPIRVANQASGSGR